MTFLGVLQFIFYIIVALLVLLFMITVHELGHYAAGKIFKFTILEFAIGFGPAIYKRTLKSGEIFSIRIFPLGGYCAFGEDDISEDKTKAELALGEETAAEVKAEATPSASPPPIERGMDGKKKWQEQKPWQRIIVLAAGAFMNFVVSILIILVLFASYGQNLIRIDGVMMTEEKKDENGNVTEIIDYSSYNNFVPGDIIKKIEGKTMYLTSDYQSVLKGKKKGDIIRFTVINNGSEFERDVTIRRDINVKNLEDNGLFYCIGVNIEWNEDGSGRYMLENQSVRLGFFETIAGTFVYAFKIAGTIFVVLGQLLTGVLSLNALGGPVTTISLTAQVASMGFKYLLEIMAFIGVNLALFNILPLPALDGSRIVFTAIEWVRGKPVNRKVEAYIHFAGIILLLGFAVFVDLLKLF